MAILKYLGVCLGRLAMFRAVLGRRLHAGLRRRVRRRGPAHLVRGRRVIAHSAGPFLLLLLSSSFLPASHMVTKTESTNESPVDAFTQSWIKQTKVN